MHVLVDASILKPGLGGIATFAEGVARELARRPGVRVTVATSSPAAFAGAPDAAVVRLAPAVRGFGRRLAWRERRLPALARDIGADVLLAATAELPLRRAGVPSVVVVHDVGPLTRPGLYGRGKRARFRLLLGPVVRRATRVACVSAATRAELAAVQPRLRVPVRVVGEGPRLAPGAPWSPADPPYVLYVGPLLRHKNVATLVRAFADPALRGVTLRIAGAASDAERARLVADAARAGAAVDHRGFVGDAELASLYAGARAVALPSLHEGFGLPLLEALGAGVPTVASAIPAHAEVGGDAPRWVGGDADADAWARALAAELAEPDGSERTRAGRERAAAHTWERAGDELLAVLREAAEEG